MSEIAEELARLRLEFHAVAERRVRRAIAYVIAWQTILFGLLAAGVYYNRLAMDRHLLITQQVLRRQGSFSRHMEQEERQMQSLEAKLEVLAAVLGSSVKPKGRP